MQKFILKNNNRFQILNVLTDIVDVFRPKLFEPVKLRVLTRKKKNPDPRQQCLTCNDKQEQ